MATTEISAPAADAVPAADQITSVLVVGAGQMGSGIAQVAACAGRTVTLADADPAGLDRARTGIAKSVERLHSKGRLTDTQAAATETLIGYTGEIAAGAGAQLAVEAITEHQETKLGVIRELDRILSTGAIITSNTSSIPITRLAAATDRPEFVAGMHFMNPVPMLQLVEVVSGQRTLPAVTQTVSDLARAFGKTPVQSADVPGFITNRILMPMINEAFFCLGEGVGTAEDIDAAMQLGMLHPQGPLRLADLIGLDTCLAIMQVLHRDLGDDKYRPAPLLRRYVDAGLLGRKSGEGVYAYGNR